MGPSYSVSLSGGSATGVIFVDGVCEAQSTGVTGTYVFDDAACTSSGAAPVLVCTMKQTNVSRLNDHLNYVSIVSL